MKRRDFISGLGVTAFAVPAATRATETTRRVSVLFPGRSTDAEFRARLEALTRALQELGWADGRNVRIEPGWIGGNPDAIREIVARAPNVIVSSGSILTSAMQRATSTIPVVFVMVNDPVSQGFVASLARPGHNITGFSNIDFATVGKSVELLKTMVPRLNRVGLMFNSDAYPIYDRYLRVLQNEPRRPIDVVRAAVRVPADIDAVMSTLAAQPGSGVDVLADGGFTVAHRAAILAALERYRVPSIAPFRQFASEGALMSYGPDDIDVYRRAAGYVDRILKGLDPAELPVQQPVKFNLIINGKTAKSLGCDIPPMLFALADEVIE